MCINYYSIISFFLNVQNRFKNFKFEHTSERNPYLIKFIK
jgi:hypothetical protein